MIKNELNKKYFEWINQLVYNEKYSKRLSYRKLLTYLHDTEFVYIIEMDSNRAEDGIDLRYRFGYEYRYEESTIATYLDNRPCSILEMMIALSIRCEKHIMDDPNIGDRTGLWFWSMIDNLGLDVLDDKKFNESYFEKVISRFLNREYKRNGEGGLFTVNRSKYDLRTSEIWHQMCWYLDEVLSSQ